MDRDLNILWAGTSRERPFCLSRTISVSAICMQEKNRVIHHKQSLPESVPPQLTGSLRARILDVSLMVMTLDPKIAPTIISHISIFISKCGFARFANDTNRPKWLTSIRL